MDNKIIGLDKKDFYDLLIKILGFSTIIFTWLNYTHERNEKERIETNKIKLEYSDSLKNNQANKDKLLKDYKDSLQLEKQNWRSDNETILNQLNFFRQIKLDRNNDLENRKNYEQRNQLFQKQWLNSLQISESQRIEERNKVFAQTQLDLYLQTTSSISSLLENIKIGDNKQIDIQKLNELGLKIRLFKNDSIYQSLLKFKKQYDDLKSCIQIKQDYDKIEISTKDLMFYSYLIRNKLNNIDKFDSRTLSYFDVISDSSILDRAAKCIKLLGGEYDVLLGDIKSSKYNSVLINSTNAFLIFSKKSDTLQLMSKTLKYKINIYVQDPSSFHPNNKGKIYITQIEAFQKLKDFFKDFHVSLFSFITDSYKLGQNSKLIIDDIYVSNLKGLDYDALMIQEQMSKSNLFLKANPVDK